MYILVYWLVNGERSVCHVLWSFLYISGLVGGWATHLIKISLKISQIASFRQGENENCWNHHLVFLFWAPVSTTPGLTNHCYHDVIKTWRNHIEKFCTFLQVAIAKEIPLWSFGFATKNPKFSENRCFKPGVVVFLLFARLHHFYTCFATPLKNMRSRQKGSNGSNGGKT